MRRLIGGAVGLVLVLFMLVPATFAADPTLTHTGRVLIATEGDITVPAGDQADVVVVVNGTATIEGQVNTIVVVDGNAVLTGALTETVVAIRSPVDLGPNTIVRNDVFTLDSLVHKEGNAAVQGEVRDIATQLVGIGFVLGPLLLLLFIGFAIATVAAALLVAALGARQVRAAEALISHQPGEALVAGVLGIFVPILLLVGLFVSVVGVPLALGILFVAWPLVAFLGYIVAGIWIGDWVLARSQPGVVRERPYLAAILGLVLLSIMGLFPPLSAIASLFGYGAVVLLAWRTFRHHGLEGSIAPTASTPAPMPI